MNKKLYIVGIKGQGMTALAIVLQAHGYLVSGSDVADTFSTDAVLHEHGIVVHKGFDPTNVPQNAETVVYSTAYTPEHPELVRARELNIPIATYPEMLGQLFADMDGIAVAGSHGKTTTTALLGVILTEAKMDPTVIVGSPIPAFKGNARVGKSQILVVETDEYQNKFTKYTPHHLVVTNIDWDHPDFFPTPQEYEMVFQAFMHKIPVDGILVVHGDDPVIAQIVPMLHRGVTTFGRSEKSQFHLLKSDWKDGRQHFSFTNDGTAHEWTIRLPGEYNTLNALAATAMARALGVPWEKIEKAVADFTGVARRFEHVGEFNGALLIDDFAHHPTEVAAAISAARQEYPTKRIVVVFHPHTYSRTKALLDNFAKSLALADEVIVMEIFGSAREKERTVSAADVVKKIPMEKKPQVLAAPKDVAGYLRNHLSGNDIVLLLGAGEQWRVAGELRNEEGEKGRGNKKKV